MKKIKRETTEGAVNAFVLIGVSTSADSAKLASKIKKIEGVTKVQEITGQYDIVANLSRPTVPKLNQTIDEIRKIPGVQDQATTLILRTV